MPFAMLRCVSSICNSSLPFLCQNVTLGLSVKHKTDPHEDLAVKFLSQHVTSYIRTHF